jgi:hypothetical protein
MGPLLHAFWFLEVMDKELSTPVVWLVFLILGLLGFVLGRRSRLAGLLVIAVIALNAIFQLLELHDPFVGPDILAEAGRSYFVQSYAAIAISFGLAIAGTLVRRDNKNRQTD